MSSEIQSQHSQAAVNRLFEVFADASLDAFEKITKILWVGIDHFGLESGLISSVSGDVYTVYASEGKASESLAPGITFPLSDTFCQYYIDEVGQLAISDVSKSDWAGSKPHTALGDFSTFLPK